MPTYDYQCSECDHVFEAFRKISERNDISELVCPACTRGGSSNYIMSSPMIVSGVGSLSGRKTDAGWKETLSKIKEANLINNIKT